MRPTSSLAKAALAVALTILSAGPGSAQSPARPTPPSPPAAETPGDAAIRKWVETHPDVLLETINRYVVREKEKETLAKNERSAQFVAELADAKGQPVIGNPEGAVTLVYVLDGACGYCKMMTKLLDDVAAKSPDLRIVHRWVAFLGPSSEYAARVAYLVNKRHPAQYKEYYHEIMSQKGQLTNDVVDRILSEVLTGDVALQVRAEVVTGASRGEVDDFVKANVELAHRAGIEGTPTFLVPGQGVDGILRGAQQPDAIARVIAKARTSAGAKN